MRKALLLTLALLLSATIYAQKRGTLLKETFDSAELPEGWTITGNNTQNWSVSESNLCGGNANEMKLSWEPIFYNGFTRLTSPGIDLTGIDSVLVSFKHYVDIYTTFPSTIGIATSSTNGARWDICYEETFTSDGQHNINKVIANSDMGKENVIIALFFKGNSANINAVYFDDIEISVTDNINAKITSIDIPDNINQGNTEISFSLQNIGHENITSFEANYELNGNTYTQTFETDMAFLDTKQFTFEQKATLTPDKYDLFVNITTVNGKEDEDVSDNMMSKNINVALGSAQRKPLIEHFSSSTCGPCVSVNNAMLKLTNDNPGKYTYTKYALYFPSPGDAYNTEECNIRKEYYYVTAAPNVVLNGKNLGSSPISQYQLNESYNEAAFVNIAGAFNTESNNINVIVDIMSYVDLNNVKAFVSVNEKTTTGNKGTNGEEEFHHIMMKMLNNANGNDININHGEYQRLEFSYDMNSTHVEEMDDLEVAVWVQNLVSGEVLNSNFLYEYTEHPYPAQNLIMKKDGNDIIMTWEAPEKGTPTGYNLYINNELVLENSLEMSYTAKDIEGLYSAEIVALYNEKKSVGIMQKYQDNEALKENQDRNINIYPNPVQYNLNIDADTNINEINIYNIIGVNVFKEENFTGNNINVSNFKSGIYIIKMNTDKGEVIKRFIKK